VKNQKLSPQPPTKPPQKKKKNWVWKKVQCKKGGNGREGEVRRGGGQKTTAGSRSGGRVNRGSVGRESEEGVERKGMGGAGVVEKRSEKRRGEGEW